jgi:hypothetical protein
MARDRVPHVSYEVQWLLPRPATIANAGINADAAGTRMRDAADAVVRRAIEDESGVASITITVRRVAAKPPR